MADTSSLKTMFLARPTLSSHSLTSQSPLTVSIEPVVLFSILDHALRRNANQKRVIGTMLGVRSDDGTEIEIRNCFAVPHNESNEQVEVDMEYHKQLLTLHLRQNPKEVLIGWYATSPELNSFSALIQNFYYTGEGGTFPQPCIHLTLSTDLAAPLSIKTYISTTVGVSPERSVDSCLFVPVSHEVNYSSEADRAGLELIASAKNSSARTAPLLSDSVALAKTLEQVHGMIVRVQNYIRNLLETNAWDNPEARKIGRSLMDTLALAPRLDATELERMFNSHLQDVLMVVYLSNLVRSQFDVANRLAVVVT